MQENILNEYKSVQDQIKELTEKAEFLKREIKMGISLGETKIVGEFSVSLVQRTRIDIDKEAVKEALGERFESVQKISGYEVLTVKKK